MLREFLHFAETGKIAAGQATGADFDSPFEEAVANVIRRNGYQVEPQVGVSGFRVDLGVLDPVQPGHFALGIECDGAAYHSARSARDRDRLRQKVLEDLGWQLYRIWSTDWFRHRERETKKLLSAIADACGRGPKSPASTTTDDNNGSDEDVSSEAGADSQQKQNEPSFEPRSSFAPYAEYKLGVPRRISLHELDDFALSRIAIKVVEHEAPIHTEEVAHRIREAFGLERTGARIVENVRRALRLAKMSGDLSVKGEFWSVPGRTIEKPRDRRHAAATLRRSDRIAPEEYRSGIVAVLTECVALEVAELVVGVARALGFDRTGNDLHDAILKQVKSMIAEGGARETSGRIMLPE